MGMGAHGAHQYAAPGEEGVQPGMLGSAAEDMALVLVPEAPQPAQHDQLHGKILHP